MHVEQGILTQKIPKHLFFSIVTHFSINIGWDLYFSMRIVDRGPTWSVIITIVVACRHGTVEWRVWKYRNPLSLWHAYSYLAASNWKSGGENNVSSQRGVITQRERTRALSMRAALARSGAKCCWRWDFSKEVLEFSPGLLISSGFNICEISV